MEARPIGTAGACECPRAYARGAVAEVLFKVPSQGRVDGGRLDYRLSEFDRWMDAHQDSFTDEQIEATRAIER